MPRIDEVEAGGSDSSEDDRREVALVNTDLGPNRVLGQHLEQRFAESRGNSRLFRHACSLAVISVSCLRNEWKFHSASS
jgi:hypothetical protein